MVKEYLIGLMGDNMKVNIKKTKSMVMEFLFGQMGKFMKDIGRMGNKMERAY